MNKTPIFWAGILFVLLALIACTPQAAQVDTPIPQNTPTDPPAPVQETYADPFAYCAAVGTLDVPDVRYTGPKVNEALINGFKLAAGLQDSSMPMEMFESGLFWRCMNNQVYACHVGANLPCESKADTNQTPNPAMLEYCKQNPNAEFIPAAATGHATVYTWRCVNDMPQVLEQVVQVDPAGYLAHIWYPIRPDASSQPASTAPAGSNEIPNPASQNCVQLGGTLQIETRGNLGQYGVCYFEDNRQCEEWALFRGECPAGGLKVTGYVTEAARFCAITGGEYAITGSSAAGDEQGTCTFTSGTSCDVWEYYNGACSPNG